MVSFQEKCFLVNENDLCPEKWFLEARQRSKVNAEGEEENELDGSGGSDIIKSNE